MRVLVLISWTKLERNSAAPLAAPALMPTWATVVPTGIFSSRKFSSPDFASTRLLYHSL